MLSVITSHKFANHQTIRIELVGQMVHVIRRLLLVREIWGSNLELIKSPTRCQRLETANQRWSPSVVGGHCNALHARIGMTINLLGHPMSMTEHYFNHE